MNSHGKLKALLSLAKAEEQAEFAECEAKASQLTQAYLDGYNDTDQYAQDETLLIAKIQALPAEKVLKFAEAGEEFKMYCERHSLWKNQLNERGYHGDNLPAVTLDEEDLECTNVNQYIGQFLFSQWEQNKEDLELLDKACEQNIFPALDARCNLNLLQLQNNINNFSSSEIKDIEDTIMQDIESINTYYWAPGHIYSLTVFIKLAILHDTPIQGEEDAFDEPRKMYFLNRALECELTAQALFNHPLSQAIYNEHGINESLQQTGYTLPQAEQKLLDILAINEFDDKYKNTKEKVEEKFKKFKM